MSKSVLCAMDISNPDEDNKVLEVAAKLAKMEDAQLDVISVVPDFGSSLVGGFFDEDYQQKVLTKAKQTLKSQVAKVLGDAMNAQVRHVIAFGKTYQEVLKTAEATRPVLIVVGAHKPDFADYLLGANASRIIRHSNCSVYVVR